MAVWEYEGIVCYVRTELPAQAAPAVGVGDLQRSAGVAQRQVSAAEVVAATTTGIAAEPRPAEALAGIAVEPKPAEPQHVPLFRAFNGKDHFYTANKSEYDGLPAKYQREGIACYVAGSPDETHQPLYRFYNSAKDDHIYTASEAERSSLASSKAWKSEGIACYVRTEPAEEHVPLYRSYNSSIVDHFMTTSWEEVEKAADPVIRMITTFNPAVHGFKFANSFVVSPSVFGIGVGSWKMGFCGGMCAAALNRYRRGVPITTTYSTPVEGSPLYEELLARQTASIPPEVVSMIYNWQSAPDVGHWWLKHSVGHRTKEQWPKLRSTLRDGWPVNLILIRVEGYTANISDNHQVLAIGYIYNSSTKDLTIQVYDPNDASQVHVLSMNLSSNNIHAKDSTGKHLRGFFVNPAGKAASA